MLKWVGNSAHSADKSEIKDAKPMADSQMKNEGQIKKGMTNQGCAVCGLRNHNTDDCRRKLFCELCGYANHTTLECRREPFWNVGPELCAAQVPNLSFFFIDENIDTKTSKEKACFAVITVVKGELSAKQIEAEFKSIVSNGQWKWSAKKIAENKFSMRFPTAKMILDYANFNLGVKGLDVQFTVEPWTSAMGAKGQLQQAWFRVSGIPIDQRGLRELIPLHVASIMYL